MKYALAALMAFCAVTSVVASTPMNGIDAKKWETAKASYIAQLKHENPGVAISSAGFIRKYRIVEAKESLREALKCDNCEALKVAVALALIEIDPVDGLAFINEMATQEQSELVAAFYRTILQSESKFLSEPISGSTPSSDDR
jgi:hypothetical protein